MKTTILYALLLIPFLSIAQQSPSLSFFEKHSEDKGTTSVYITEHTFDFFSRISENEEALSFKKAVSTLKSIKVLESDRTSNRIETNIFHTELLPSLSKYEEILKVKEEGQIIRIFIYEKQHKITEFVVLNYGPSENILVIMEGEDIDIKQLASLSETMNINGIDHIDEINKN